MAMDVMLLCVRNDGAGRRAISDLELIFYFV